MCTARIFGIYSETAERIIDEDAPNANIFVTGTSGQNINAFQFENRQDGELTNDGFYLTHQKG